MAYHNLLFPMMDYRLHVFRRVAEMRSLTKASKALHLSQPAVTRHVKRLEEELRVPLFVRGSNGVILTESGKIFLQHVSDTEKIRAGVLARLQAPAGRLSGRLVLGSSLTIASYHLPEVLVRFKAKHPLVSCDVVEGNTDFVISLLADQRIQAGLVEGPCRRREIQARPFYEDELIWIASPADPLARVHHPTIRSLCERPIISREPGSGTRRVMETALRQHGIRLAKLRVAQELSNTEANKRMVAAGAGIGCVSRLSVQQELALGTLVEVQVPHLRIRRAFSVLIPQGPDAVGIVQAFSKFLNQGGREPRR